LVDVVGAILAVVVAVWAEVELAECSRDSREGGVVAGEVRPDVFEYGPPRQAVRTTVLLRRCVIPTKESIGRCRREEGIGDLSRAGREPFEG
jgi:hypothetical protein